MAYFSEQNTLGLADSIKCEVTLEEAIITLLECNPSKQKKVLEEFRERALRLGMKHYFYNFKFQDLVDDCKKQVICKEVERLFTSYHNTQDPITKVWLKNRLLKEFRLLIKNRQDFEEVAKYYKEKLMQTEPEEKLTSLSDFDQTESVKFLIPEIIPQQGLVLLTGLPKLGKSSLACDMAYSVVSGKPLFNRPISQGKVLVISLDENRRETEAKYKARGFNRLENAEENIKFIYKINSLASLEKFIKQHRPNLVIFDSLEQLNCKFNISENSQKIGEFLSKLKALLEKYKAVGLIIHHANKTKSNSTITKIRGSSAIAASTSVNLFLEAKNNQILLTATGRDIIACEYQLTLNSRENWETRGVYSLLDENENSNTPEQILEKDEQEIVLKAEELDQTPRENAVQIEETCQTPPESKEDEPVNNKISTPKIRRKLPKSLLIKKIIDEKGKISNDELIEAAVEFAITEQQIDNYLKLLQKNGQITTIAEASRGNNPRALVDIYYLSASE